MKDILTKQTEIKKTHEEDFHVVEELRQHSAAHRAVLDRLAREVGQLRKKQEDRKILKNHKQQLYEKAKALKDKKQESGEKNFILSDDRVPCVPEGKIYSNHTSFVDRLRNEIEEIAVFEREVSQRCAAKAAMPLKPP